MGQAVTKSSNVLAEERTELALYRTALAASRSLMAWVRTGLSMNGFGYTVYKFVLSFADRVEPHAAHHFGLFLIGLGTLSILFGCIEYWQTAREMREVYQVPMRKFPLIMAGLLGSLGLLLFLGVILRII
jgi:putative membrane protein